MEVDRSRWFAPRLFMGLVVVTLGVLALLDNLDIVEVDHPMRLWPLIFVAIGLARMLRPSGAPGRFGGFLFFFVGTWILLRNLDVVPISLFQFWPVILLLIGGRLVWGAMTRPEPSMVQGSDSSSQVNSFAMLSGAEHQSNAPDFRGGDATAILGSCKIDLRQAGIKSGEAVIETFALWGGIEIVVPPEWTVVNMGTPILGAFEDKTRPPQLSSGPRLVIKGVVIMGGVEIKN